MDKVEQCINALISTKNLWVKAVASNKENTLRPGL